MGQKRHLEIWQNLDDPCVFLSKWSLFKIDIPIFHLSGAHVTMTFVEVGGHWQCGSIVPVGKCEIVRKYVVRFFAAAVLHGLIL